MEALTVEARMTYLEAMFKDITIACLGLRMQVIEVEEE